MEELKVERRGRPARASPTLRQLEALRVISGCLRSGLAPTIREIGEKLDGISINAVNDLLLGLERRGCLERGRHQARAMRITDLGRSFLQSARCELCGSVVSA